MIGKIFWDSGTSRTESQRPVVSPSRTYRLLYCIAACQAFLWVHESHAGGWTRSESGTSVLLDHVCLTNLTNGTAVGLQGIILHTPGGGAAWTSSLREDLPQAWSPTPRGRDSFFVVPGHRDSLTRVDFADYCSDSGNTVSGVVVFDRNESGTVDPGKQPIPGWCIYVRGPKNDSAVTDESGKYWLFHLPPGEYTVEAQARRGWVQSHPAGAYSVIFHGLGQGYDQMNFALHREQSRIRIPFRVSDSSVSAHKDIAWGVRAGAAYGFWHVDPNATVIDSFEGEFEIPPRSYPVFFGFFDARLEDPRRSRELLGEGGWTDMRDFRSPDQRDTFYISFTPSYITGGDYPMKLRWSKELVQNSFGGPVTLSDQFGSAVDMKATDSVFIADKRVYYVLIVTQGPNLPSALTRQWALVSVPSLYGRSEIKALFPSAVSPAFSWPPGIHYRANPVMDPGEGYWLKCSFPADTSLLFTGAIGTPDTMIVHRGWNIIGSSLHNVDVSTVATIPPGIIAGRFVAYAGRYTFTDTLMPYRGYWVKADTDGILVLNAAGPGLLARGGPGAVFREALARSSSLRIHDATGCTQTLFFASTTTADVPDLHALELPPLPPAGIFDARYASNSLLEVVEGGLAKECPILLSSAVYPVHISWDCTSDSVVSSLRVSDRKIPMRGSGEVTISGPQRQIVLTIKGRGSVPARYVLMQNYPNPFNPTTTIRYTLPNAIYVTLKVYDILGRELKTLVDAYQGAGYKSVQFDATHYASGIYFYRLQAGKFTDTKRLLLLR